jgi:hypothetical protein
MASKDHPARVREKKTGLDLMEEIGDRGSDQRPRRESCHEHDPSLRDVSVKRVAFTKSTRRILDSDTSEEVLQSGQVEAIRLTSVHFKIGDVECAKAVDYCRAKPCGYRSRMRRRANSENENSL